MPVFKLTYFDTKGRGELIRWIFSYANQPFEDERIKQENWPSIKEETPYGKLPALHVDGKYIYSTSVICRYLGKVLNLMPEDAYQSTVCDEVVDGLNDILMPAFTLGVAKSEGKMEEFEKLRVEFVEKTFPPVAKALTSRLNEHEWYGGNKIAWADIYAANSMCWIQDVVPGILTPFPVLKTHLEKVILAPGIQNWLKKSP